MTNSFDASNNPPKHTKTNLVQLAVNGTLMRGLELNGNLLAVGAQFVGEATTAPLYRLWSINNRHPAMQRDPNGGRAIALEIWALSPEAIATILQQEPPGLAIGFITLDNGQNVLGVLGEAYLCTGQREITEWGGWRAYMASLAGAGGTDPHGA